MLRITKAQMEDFSNTMEKSFMERTLHHLRSQFSEALKLYDLQEQTRLEAFVRHGLDDAESFGVIHEQDVRLYLECQLLFHPRFAHDPALPHAAETLRRQDLSGTEKMDLIHDWMILDARGSLQWP